MIKYAKFLDNIKLKNYTIISSKYNFTDVEEFLSCNIIKFYHK